MDLTPRQELLRVADRDSADRWLARKDMKSAFRGLKNAEAELNLSQAHIAAPKDNIHADLLSTASGTLGNEPKKILGVAVGNPDKPFNKALDGLIKGSENGTVDLNEVLHHVQGEKEAIKLSEQAIFKQELALQRLKRAHSVYQGKLDTLKESPLVGTPLIDRKIQKLEHMLGENRLGKHITQAEQAVEAAKAAKIELVNGQRFANVRPKHIKQLEAAYQKQFAKSFKTMGHEDLGAVIKDLETKGRMNFTGVDPKLLKNQYAGVFREAEKTMAHDAAAALHGLGGPSTTARAMNAIEKNGPGIWKGIKATAGGVGTVATATKVAGTRALKFGGVAGLVVLGAGLLLTNKNGKKFDPMDQPIAPLPPLLTPQDLMMQQQAQMMPQGEMGPAEGYAPNQWQSYVRPGQQQQQQVGAAQPRMSAIAPESVQNLGMGGMVPQV